MTIYRLHLRAHDPLLLGTGRGAGYSTATARSIPASTLLGAIAAAYQRSGEPRGEIVTVMAGVSASDAILSAPLPLDRYVCKCPTALCPQSYPWNQAGPCPLCGSRLERSKGEPDVPRIVRTRVELDDRGRAVAEKLFAREALAVRGEVLSAYFRGDAAALGLVAGAELRVGAERSVGGRVRVAAVTAESPATLTAQHLRLELLAKGVFVDDFGFASDRPSPALLESALGVTGGVDRAYVRWTTAGGWARQPNRPKPEDPAVIAASVFHVTLPAPAIVPRWGPGLACAAPRAAAGSGSRIWTLRLLRRTPNEVDRAQFPGQTATTQRRRRREHRRVGQVPRQQRPR
ncbi:MAG: hypothetical protein ACOYEV_17235 [Candidatus Nanopelagicales bacterium]